MKGNGDYVKARSRVVKTHFQMLGKVNKVVIFECLYGFNCKNVFLISNIIV